MRLDSYLYVNGSVDSRNKAQQLIKLGRISVNGKIETKPSREVSDGDSVNILKQLDICGDVAIDIGASNGGFTSCMLGRGVKKVYAVDVGECVFSKELLSDTRVMVRDRLNARDVKVEDIGERADFISIDVSFISLTLILKNTLDLLKDDGRCVALIKPQFEAGRKALSKKGMVLDKKERLKAVFAILDFIADIGYKVTDFTVAPIRENRNTEYLILIERTGFNVMKNKIEAVIMGEKSL